MPSVMPVPGKPNLLLGAYDIADVGYTAAEFFVSGTASSYAGEGASGQADYTTRIVVMTPTDTAKFNGTVLVEWLNVSGGIDAAAVWFMAHREIARAGYAYVVVSAQQVGVQGGATMTGFDMSLKKQDPERYSRLESSWGRLFVRHLQPDRQTGPRDLGRRGAGAVQAGTRCGGWGVPIGDVPDNVRQRCGSAREGLRRLPGPFPIRRRGAAGRRLRVGGVANGPAGRRPVPARSARPGDDRHHGDRPRGRRSVGLLPGQDAGQRTAADMGDPRHRARRQLHDQGRFHRQRFRAAGPDRRRVRTDRTC